MASLLANKAQTFILGHGSKQSYSYQARARRFGGTKSPYEPTGNSVLSTLNIVLQSFSMSFFHSFRQGAGRPIQTQAPMFRTASSTRASGFWRPRPAAFLSAHLFQQLARRWSATDRSSNFISGLLRPRCFVTRPFIRLRHILNELGLSSCRIRRTTSDSDRPTRSWMVSKDVLSSQAI